MSSLVKKTPPRVFKVLPARRIVFEKNLFCGYGIVWRGTGTLRKNVGFPRPLTMEDLAPALVVCRPRVRPVRVESRREKTRIDDTLSRAHIWKTLFGDEPMPDIEDNAAKKYSGTLNLPDDFDFDKILRKVRKGH
jgi:hypothetical protein